ncbi:MAG: hypothetical protein QM703_25980 [Gemmatales bacterium]
MTRFFSFLFVATLGLILTAAAQADGPAKPASVEVDGKAHGSVQLHKDGVTNLPKLATGHNVSVNLKDGVALSAKATDSHGHTLKTTVQNNAAHRTIIIIIIIEKGPVIVIVIRT